MVEINVTLVNLKISCECKVSKPEWRNWQTRQVEGLVPVMGVQVQVLSPALYRARTYGE